MSKYVVTTDRFVAGDFPAVCCRSGLTATKFVPVEARRNPLAHWLFFPGLWFFLLQMFGRSSSPNLWGKLPFADGQVRDVEAEVERGIGVILRNVHPDFVAASKRPRP